jgi:hypothetical protein
VKIDAAAQMSNGDWLIMDDDEKGLQRFSRTGTYVNVVQRDEDAAAGRQRD